MIHVYFEHVDIILTYDVRMMISDDDFYMYALRLMDDICIFSTLLLYDMMLC